MDFRLPPELEVVHQTVRLRIVTALFRERDIGFAALRQHLSLTAGNLASHLEKLEAAGVIHQRKVFGPNGTEARITITRVGAERFQRYLSLLREYLAAQA